MIEFPLGCDMEQAALILVKAAYLSRETQVSFFNGERMVAEPPEKTPNRDAAIVSGQHLKQVFNKEIGYIIYRWMNS